jgi:hypothetical protein
LRGLAKTGFAPRSLSISQIILQARPTSTTVLTGSFIRRKKSLNVATSKIESYYENGALTTTMPKAEEKKRKQIQVKVASGPKAIEGKN